MDVLGSGVPLDWYRDAFVPSMGMMPWTDHPEEDLEMVSEILEPMPGARILDLACGTGHHACLLAQRGYSVVGVDLSEDLLDFAFAFAEPEKGNPDRDLDLEYLRLDVRELTFTSEFDIVLNLHSGAVGYLEDEAENRRTFETIARSLRPGGRTLMQIPNVLHAESTLPAKTWTEGKWAIELLDRRWNPFDRYVEGSMVPIVLDDPGSMAAIEFRQRLYSIEELFELFCSVGMSLEAVLDDVGTPCVPTEAEAEIVVVASRN